MHKRYFYIFVNIIFLVVITLFVVSMAIGLIINFIITNIKMLQNVCSWTSWKTKCFLSHTHVHVHTRAPAYARAQELFIPQPLSSRCGYLPSPHRYIKSGWAVKVNQRARGPSGCGTIRLHLSVKNGNVWIMSEPVTGRHAGQADP